MFQRTRTSRPEHALKMRAYWRSEKGQLRRQQMANAMKAFWDSQKTAPPRED